MGDRRPTVADLRALRGKRQLAMLQVNTLEEAEAAQRAGIDILSVDPSLLTPQFRDAAPTCFAIPGLDYGVYVTEDDYLRAAFAALASGGDAVYCAASTRIVRRLAEEGIPVCGHTGLIPSTATWTGGFKAVGRTADSAMLVWRQVRALEEAGAFMAEIEVVPSAVASAISQRTELFLISMGSGSGCDAQYLFAEDVLGYTRGHFPRHAKRYRDFAAEYRRLQQERVAAFSEYAAEVASGVYPGGGHQVAIADEELAQFLAALEATPGGSGG